MKILVNFLNSVDTSTGGDGDIGEIDSDPEHAEYVCSFRFADLRRNGSLSLVAGLGVPNRPSCRDVYIIDKTSSGLEIYLSGGGIDVGADVSASIKDLRQDGNLELLLDNGLASIRSQCGASWITIYAWTGGGYTNVSDRFKDFYRQRLDSLNKKLSALRPTRGPGGYDQRDKECLQAEAAKIQRFLGIPSEAGINQAIRLANSKNSAERSFAAEILGDIGTPKARKYLETLAKDSDGDVATTAKYCLSVLSKGPMQDAPAAFERLQQQEPISSH